MDYDFQYIEGTNNTLVINFSSKGKEWKDKVVPEFSKSLKPLGCHIGHVMDKTKSWFNTPNIIDGITKEIDILQKKVNPKKVVFMGLSMGGFGAILFSKLCFCDVVLAFSPQIDIDPKLTSWDTRYHNYFVKDFDFIVPHIRNHFNKTSKYIIVLGNNKIDKKHIELIPKQKNINIIVNKDLKHHNPLKIWKEQNILTNQLRQLIEPI